MVKVVRRVDPIKSTRRKFGDLVRDLTVGTPVNYRHHVALVVGVRVVPGELSFRIVPCVYDARILHLHGSRRLEIYLIRAQKLLKECLEL